MRVLGDEYIKSEFRAHKNAENPMHIVSVSLQKHNNLGNLADSVIGTDWILDRMADVRTEARRRFMEGREARSVKTGQDEWWAIDRG